MCSRFKIQASIINGASFDSVVPHIFDKGTAKQGPSLPTHLEGLLAFRLSRLSEGASETPAAPNLPHYPEFLIP